jgi:flavin-dependent dehydrogenase
LKSNVTRNSLEPDSPLRADVVVIGGGPAGSVCARELALRGQSVVLLERSSRARSRVGETCGPGLRRWLEGRCDLTLPRHLYRPLPTFYSAWGSGELDGRSFAFWHAAEGLVLNRGAFDEWLRKSAQEAGVTVLGGFSVEYARRGAAGWVLGCVSGRTVTAGFIVEASGRAGKSVVHADADRFFTDKLVCLSVELIGEGANDSAALIESCPEGWWYWVCLPDCKQLLALFTDADLIKPQKARAQILISLLSATRHVKRFSGPIPQDSRVRVSDARTSARKVLWRDSWLPIGDSAWSLDPLSGNGIERAVRSGFEAASAVSEMIDSKREAGLRSFALSTAKDFNESLANQSRYYASEPQWRDETFWRRRS